MEAIVGRWANGAERVTVLIEARHLQRVIGDPDTVTARFWPQRGVTSPAPR